MTGNLFDDAPDSASGWYTAHCDGGSRGNPGPAGFGAVIEDPDHQLAARLSHFLGTQTNNFAEYSALLAVLEWALKHEVKRLRVISDSELMVRQMKGQYKVSNASLRPLWEEARRRAGWLERFDIRHVLRGGNKEADRLANEAMDRGTGKNRDQDSGVRVREQGSGNRDQGSSAALPGGGPAGHQASKPYLIDRKPPAKHGPPIQRADESANRQPDGPEGRQVQETSAAESQKKTFSGYVKNGTVHLLDGELPDGVFVKVTPE
jgi:probable phosphoglycerate mutase